MQLIPLTLNSEQSIRRYMTGETKTHPMNFSISMVHMRFSPNLKKELHTMKNLRQCNINRVLFI